MSVPAGLKVSDRICIVQRMPNVGITFSAKINNPPPHTIAIVDNIFTGPFVMSKVYGESYGIYSELTIENAIRSTLSPVFVTELRGWSLNELILEGVIHKDGHLDEAVSMVAVTYRQYSGMILKDGPIYKKTLGI